MARRKSRKATHTRKRRRTRKGMADGQLLAARGKKRSRRSGGGGGSRKLLSPANLMDTGKELVGGALGGYAGGKILHMAASYTPFQRLLAFGGTAFAAHSFGFKNMGAGIMGAYGFALATGVPGMQEGEMEETDYTDKEALSEMADAMDENGNPMFLADDGELHYMEELEMEEDDMSANELLAAELLADDYPGYVQTYQFKYSKTLNKKSYEQNTISGRE